MARLDVYPMPGRAGGYLVDVQAELLDQFATRVVVPLVKETGASPMRDLNPVFEIAGERHALLTQAIATVPVRELRGRVGSLSEWRDEVTRALDILLLGF